MLQQNQVTERLSIRYPLIQAPMLGPTTPEMAAAVSNAGGLGSLPVGGLSPERTRALIRATRALTDKPFAVNLFVHSIPPGPEPQVLQAMQQLLERTATAHGITIPAQGTAPFQFYTYKDQVAILIEEQVQIVSFTFGIPDPESIRAMQQHGIVLIGTATCAEEAVLLEQQGIDMVTAQGIEAGGHRGTFIEDGPLPRIGLMALIPSILEKVRIPLIAAGGISNGAAIKAAMNLGADGVQLGTAFLACPESAAIPSYKAALPHTSDRDTTLTKAFSGRWARGLRNELMDIIEQSGLTIPPYPYQNTLTTAFRASAQQLDLKGMTNLWAGQRAAAAEKLPAAQIFRKLVEEWTAAQ